MATVAEGFGQVFTAKGFGQALAIALVVYVVLVILSNWQDGRYLPGNVGTTPPAA